MRAAVSNSRGATVDQQRLRTISLCDATPKSSVVFTLNRLKRRFRNLAIDAYRVAAVFRRELFSRRIDPNQVGFPVRHVAINTVVHHSRAEPGRNFTLAGLMTRQAFLSELNQFPLF